jgi:bacterioferritin-associated ferredoxin
MWVCLCRAVNATTVRQAIGTGARSVKAVGAACGAGTDCTRCLTHIKALLREHAEFAADGEPAITGGAR